MRNFPPFLESNVDKQDMSDNILVSSEANFCLHSMLIKIPFNNESLKICMTSVNIHHANQTLSYGTQCHLFTGYQIL